MRFRLTCEGELKASQKDPLDMQVDKLAEHKQSLRKHFHLQLKHLWETNWFLSTHKVFPADYGASTHAARSLYARWAPKDDAMMPLVDAVALNHQEHGYAFVPLVREDWRLLCSLDILFLRRDPPGSMVHAGDLDNRIKTLIDGLRKPNNANELRGNEQLTTDETPFFCLVEDDKLVTGLRVESDTLLDPPGGASEHDRRQVRLVITVDVRPYDATLFNLSFAGA